MTDGTANVSRRGFLTAAAGGAAAAATAGSAAAQNGPDFGGWFDNVPNFDGVVDKTGPISDGVPVVLPAESVEASRLDITCNGVSKQHKIRAVCKAYL